VAADVFDLAPVAAYQKLHGGKVPRGKAYPYATIISGNGSDKIMLTSEEEWNPRCTVSIKPEGDKRSRLAVSFNDDSVSEETSHGLSMESARKRCIEWVDATLTDRKYNPQRAKGGTASGWPADVVDHHIERATPKDLERQREMQKWRDEADVHLN